MEKYYEDKIKKPEKEIEKKEQKTFEKIN